MNFRHWFIIILSLCVAACGGRSGNMAVLSQAESLMTERPDSALVVLQQINASELSGKKAQAKYALLLSQAFDKNYIDKTDFEVLQPAIDYYENHGTSFEQFLTLYYQGRILQNGEAYAQAMLAYTKAEELIPHIADDYYAGLLYAQMGIIYEKLYDYPKSLAAYQKAFQHYTAADKTSHQFYTKLDIGQLYIQLEEYEAAEQNLKEVLQWGYANGKISICRSCFGILCRLYEATGNIEAMQRLSESKYAELLKDDQAVLRTKAYISARNSDSRKAREYLDRAWTKAKVLQDTINLYRKEYQVNKQLGRYRSALEYHERVFRIEDSIVRHTLQQPVMSAQRDYFRSQAEYNALKLKSNRQFQLLAGVVSLLVLLIVALLVRQRMAAKNREIARYMDIAHHLERGLFDKAKDADDMNAEITQMNGQINKLFIKQFEFIDRLSTTYYETHGTRRDKDAIYNQVRQQIEGLSTNRQSIAELEELVNRYRKNIMKAARESLLQFSEMEFRLLCFFYAGFSAKAISLFTDDSIGNIYVKKSRLKAKISQSEAARKDEMLVFLSN